MATIVTRSGKGSPLTHAEVDSNFTNLNTDKLETAGGTMTGNLTVPNVIVSGNVDGRDVSADGAKLDGIEANADVTDTANVTAAGALMDSELTDIAAVKALNQGVATTDAPTFTNTQLDAISATIADTAVDIFVYDTRKDSDGGAWRKRTQHTSWYNETLNTSTRGSRKEFPAVAVITVDATSDYITIYDGDDPDMPMWMVFNSGGNRLIRYNTSFGGVSVVNGRMVVGNNATIGGFSIIDFVMDYGAHYNSSDTQVRKYDALANRNVSIVDGTVSSPFTTDTSSWLLNKVNDVAMTVLPNAPIDAATGLPVPTIAVATNGGVSVIKDDGNVYDVTGFQPVANVNFYGDKLAINTPVGSTSYVNIGTANLSADIANTNWREVNLSSSTSFDFKILPNQAAHQAFDDTYYSAGSVGLLSVKPDYVAPETCLHAFTTSSYNTGWMNGDIKLATLSDTDATNVTGSELVTNGTFDSDTAWTKAGGVTISGGSGNLTSVSGGTNALGQLITGLEVGQAYVVSSEITSLTFGSLGIWVNGTTLPIDYRSSTGVVTATFTAAATSHNLYVRTNNTSTASVDNVSVRLAEEDRSVNGNGLQVFGTVTKSAVASGADLVAYSGFSASNYLEQPYNSDLDFGTGDFCYMGWFKTSSNGITMFERCASPRSGNGMTVYMDGTGKPLWYKIVSGTPSIVVTPTAAYNNNTWVHFAAIRQNGVVSLYFNGQKDGSASDSTDMTNSSAIFRLGANATGTSGWTGSLALWRISATAPSPEQILKIYNDEKHLFTEGAQATLYGSSDSVTALAYDTDSELLHVGTSAGRSVFQGLRRVDNTTTAVTSAISASNGLVADE